MCSVVVLALPIVACKGKPKDEPAPSAPSPVTTSDASATAATPPPAPDASEPPKVREPGCDGWRASKTEHLGMGSSSVAVECAGEKFTVTMETVEARGDAETTTGTITRPVWNQLWQRLDAAGWTKLPASCTPVDPPPDSASMTELELSISDGTATKQITCKGVDVGAAHAQIIEALDAAAEASTNRKTR